MGKRFNGTKRRITISVTVDPDRLALFDTLRGNLKRSGAIQQLIEYAIIQGTIPQPVIP